MDSRNSKAARRSLVEKLQAERAPALVRVAAAIEAVPRELFVPGLPLDEVYRPSDAIITKRVDGVSVSSASSPEVMALMLEQLDRDQATVCSRSAPALATTRRCWPTSSASTGMSSPLDIDEDLVLGAREHLADAGFSQVAVVQTDGALGYATADRYDRIILTVASSDIAPACREQLAQPHGRLVLPTEPAWPAAQRRLRPAPGAPGSCNPSRTTCRERPHGSGAEQVGTRAPPTRVHTLLMADQPQVQAMRISQSCGNASRNSLERPP